MSGNFISTNSELNLGDSNSKTVNIKSANTLNLGSAGTTSVNINGLAMLFSSTTNNFASITSCQGPNYGSLLQSWYKLPYTTTQDLLIQWGFLPDEEDKTISFPISFSDTPYMFGTRYNNGSNNANLVIVNVSSTEFEIDSAITSTDKASFNYLAIGLINK
jgi:hypothetical protein